MEKKWFYQRGISPLFDNLLLAPDRNAPPHTCGECDDEIVEREHAHSEKEAYEASHVGPKGPCVVHKVLHNLIIVGVAICQTHIDLKVRGFFVLFQLLRYNTSSAIWSNKRGSSLSNIFALIIFFIGIISMDLSVFAQQSADR